MAHGLYMDPARWTASFGVTIKPPKMKHGLRRIIVHEKYDYLSHEYDISVADFSRPVPYSNEVHRIFLPDASHDFHPGDQMFVTGFGALQNDGDSQNHLQQVQVDLIDTKICNDPQVYNAAITPRMLCAGSLKGQRDACQEMEEFVQSSGENGIVVFTLGSMISNITEEKANVIASALAQIPQKVLWRFNGKKPDTLGPNTQLYKWVPQNDVLGHPKTKAFITHGGANGIYEAIYHGIPMVGIPLFADQFDNIAHMKFKGAAVSLDFFTLTSKDLLIALKTVINDPLYKENAMKLSRIHHDKPIKPLDRVVFWIEFVMHHKGAKHLRPAALDLTWAQFYSLDVTGFLLACVAIVTFLIIKCCLFGYRNFLKTGKREKKE
ncbi:UDP-glucuronosyltransferase 2B18-like [Choloepus didactylus]|uniref:UDP-glucuronosyltransferase 2B18-like n=1 Tax=Choloepus didactylus TaxID=27675 RepID=UPI00189F6D87|nr:UDP-glucuronosyltransferase 2B18-like [Choloepus didactylus]